MLSHDKLLWLRERLDRQTRLRDKWEVVKQFVEEESGIAFGEPRHRNKSYYIAGSSPLRMRAFEVRFIWFPDTREYQSSLVWKTDVDLMEQGDKFQQSVMVRWKTDSQGLIDLAVALIDSEKVE